MQTRWRLALRAPSKLAQSDAEALSLDDLASVTVSGADGVLNITGASGALDLSVVTGKSVVSFDETAQGFVALNITNFDTVTNCDVIQLTGEGEVVDVALNGLALEAGSAGVVLVVDVSGIDGVSSADDVWAAGIGFTADATDSAFDEHTAYVLVNLANGAELYSYKEAEDGVAGTIDDADTLTLVASIDARLGADDLSIVGPA